MNNKTKHIYFPPHTFSSNMLWSIGAKGTQAFAGFCAFILIARYLPVLETGNYTYSMAFAASFMSFSYFGIQQTVTREIAKKPTEAAQILGAGLLIRIPLILITSVVFFYYTQSYSSTDTPATALMIACIAECFRSAGQLACAVFQAYERIRHEFFLALLHAAAWGAALTCSILYEGNLLWILGATCFGLGIYATTAWRIVLKAYIRPSFSAGIKLVVPIIKISFIIGLTVIVVTNLFRINILMLTWLSSPEETAYFQISHDLILKTQIFFQAVIIAAFPVLARLEKQKKIRSRLLGALHKSIGLSALSLSIIMFSAAYSFILFIYGTKMAEAILPMQILAFATVPLALNILWSHALIVAGRQGYTLIANIAAFIINVILSALLIPAAGAAGAAASALIAYSFAAAIALFFASRIGLAPTGLVEALWGSAIGNVKQLLTEIRHPQAAEAKKR